MVFDQTVGVNRFFLDMDSEDLWSYPVLRPDQKCPARAFCI
jgi:hypothetical protein